MKRDRPGKDDAEQFAVQGLAFLAADPQRLTRFLDLTGLDPAQLRDWDDHPELQIAVLDHLLGDESLLLVFAAEIGANVDRLAPARDVLARSAGLFQDPSE